MSGGSNSTVFIGNLDEKVSERVLYDILIQAGPLVDLHIPRDKEKNKPKGYAFAEYETVEVADYAVKLFSGLVKLHNRTLRFSISGQDKLAQKRDAMVSTTSKLSNKPRFDPATNNHTETPHQHAFSSSPRSGFSAYPGNYPQVPVHPDVVYQSNEHQSRLNGYDCEYSQRVLRATMDRIRYSRPLRYDVDTPVYYPPYEYRDFGRVNSRKERVYIHQAKKAKSRWSNNGGLSSFWFGPPSVCLYMLLLEASITR